MQYCQKDSHLGQWNKVVNPEIALYKHKQLSFDKGMKAIHWKENLSTDGAGETGHPKAKNELA